jgi:hypothetical protein
LTMSSRARSGESSQADSTIAEKSDKDLVRSVFSIKRPKSREQREPKAAPITQAPRRPRTADSPRSNISDTTLSPGKSQRRKSFVGQSIHNLRKSVTDTIAKSRPKPSALTPSTSLLGPWKYDVSLLPPSPTLPSPPSAASDSRRP